jgi:hypothetical protein
MPSRDVWITKKGQGSDPHQGLKTINKVNFIIGMSIIFI